VRSLAGYARRVHVAWSRLGSMGAPVVGVVVLALGLLSLPAPVAEAAPVASGPVPIRACTTTTGVLVAVDFRFWGQPVERGCAPTPTTGYAALHTAGYATAGDAHDGDAFVCRIDDQPPPKEDGCQSTPLPPDSWSYWHALAGSGTWTFSQSGAKAYHPPPGSIDAWVFGNTSPPTFTPAEVRSGTTPAPTTTTSTASTTSTTSTTATTAPPATATTTTTLRPPTTAVDHPTTTSTRPPTVSTTTEPGRSKRVTTTHRRTARPGHRASQSRLPHRAAHSPSSTTTTTGSRPVSSSPTTALRIVNVAAGAAPAKPDGSSPLGLLVGLGGAVVLGGAGVATAWRRRRAASRA
jgi:hypothetical protein